MKINYSFVVFLYAYLNQIDLSLDRSRWESIDKLRDFYSTQISPKKVANYLADKLGLDVKKLNNLIFIGEESLWDKIKDSLLSSLKRDVILEDDKVYFLCQKLLLLDNFLEDGEQVHKLEIEKLRIEFSKLNYGTVKFKLAKKDRLKANNIEHFLQNETLSTIKICEFNKGYF
ncbi:hypothetical protein [Sphingobacterium sp. GVS05A]|uniref:hypothetical protein n=1 Tax=Sphingobacterium sp. GVS05A TaxID=2862679 RepID=UPI001CBB2BB0|nr:hypothetical protein [Sphingobacterium sp. GVS05A]